MDSKLLDSLDNLDSRDSRSNSGQGSTIAIEGEYFAPDVLLEDEDEDEGGGAGAPVIEGSLAELKKSRVFLPEGCSKADAVYHLSKSIPNNQYGFPLFFYRSDLLPHVALEGGILQAEVDNAAVSLDYSEGYPLLENAMPFWERMAHEPERAYYLFVRFRLQAEETGIRQLHALSLSEKTPLHELQALYREYYWSVRAKAYDLYNVAADTRLRQLRIRSTENAHYSAAGNLLDAVLAKLGQDPEWVEALKPEDAIKVVDTLVKVQRLSLGLTGAAASTLGGTPQGATAEVIMRQITKAVGLDAGPNTGGAFQENLRSLLEDEGTALKVQELILKVNAPQ